MTPPLQPPPDSLRAALERVFAAPEYHWEIRRRPLEFLFELFGRVVAWFAQLEEAHPVAFWVLVGVLLAVLVAILSHIAYLVWRALRPRQAVAPAAGAPPQRRDAAWHLTEAARYAGVGRYREALAHRFLALVLELDRVQAVRFHPSKTPAEYLGEARVDASAREHLRGLVQSLYRYLFGGAHCSADELAAFDRRAGELTTHVAAA